MIQERVNTLFVELLWIGGMMKISMLNLSNFNILNKDNLFFRTFGDYKDIYMPFDHLLFFSDNGCGDLFGFKI